jgi:polyisoprenoid-binding protein YceI
MKKIFIVLAFILIGGNILAQKWMPQTSSVKFRTSMLGIGVDGSFSGLKAMVDFNPENPTNASIVGTVDAKTVFTDNKMRDTHLKEKSEFFEPEKYPVLTLKSTSITKTNDGYLGMFNLTIKNVTKVVKIPFKFTQTDNKGVFSAKFEINRKDWNFGGNSFGMSDKVMIMLSLNVQK